MEIRILTNVGFWDEGRSYAPVPNSTVDVTDECAADLVKAGHAEYVSTPKPKKQSSRSKKDETTEDDS